jgi:hypothetical protein
LETTALFLQRPKHLALVHPVTTAPLVRQLILELTVLKVIIVLGEVLMQLHAMRRQEDTVVKVDQIPLDGNAL